MADPKQYPMTPGESFRGIDLNLTHRGFNGRYSIEYEFISGNTETLDNQLLRETVRRTIFISEDVRNVIVSYKLDGNEEVRYHYKFNEKLKAIRIPANPPIVSEKEEVMFANGFHQYKLHKSDFEVRYQPMVVDIYVR
jgi:hypothetical protein